MAIQSIINPNALLLQFCEQGGLDEGLVRILARYGIHTLRDFTHFTEEQIREMPRVGIKRLASIQLLLDAAGLQFCAVREPGEWRRLKGGQIRLSQLLALSVVDANRGYGNREYKIIARKARMVTFADYACSGRAAARRAFGKDWIAHYEPHLDRVYDAIEVPV